MKAKERPQDRAARTLARLRERIEDRQDTLLYLVKQVAAQATRIRKMERHARLLERRAEMTDAQVEREREAMAARRKKGRRGMNL